MDFTAPRVLRGALASTSLSYNVGVIDAADIAVLHHMV
jgi:hypothetical protein